MAFKVEFTRRANRDVDEKERWLARLGSSTVARWRARLLEAVEKLETDPHCYPKVEEAEVIGLELRHILFGRQRHIHRAVYSVNDRTRTVTIHRVRHSAQDRLTSEDI